MSNYSNGGFLSSIIKGVLTTIIVMLIGILIFAFIAKNAMLNNGAIKAVNQFIKALSIFLGCFFSLKVNNGLIKGALIGLLSGVLIYALLSLFTGEQIFNAQCLIDLIFTLIVGAISGALAVNVKKE